MIKIEMHCHSAPASRCGKIGVDVIVPELKRCGYDAVVLTNHYFNVDTRSPEEIFGQMVCDYEDMKCLGDEIGLKVFFGTELRFAGSSNDYLLYGMTPNELRDMGPIYELDPERFLAQKPEHVLIYQAHPFRKNMTRTPAEFLDGIEIYNGHPGHESQNDLALARAREFGMLVMSGSDTHFEEGIARGGVYLPSMPKNERELAQMLRGVTEADIIRPAE